MELVGDRIEHHAHAQSPPVSAGQQLQLRVVGAGDFVGDGAESVYFPTGRLTRGASINAKDSGQFGAQFKFSLDDWEFGLYAAKYHEKTPVFYFRPAALVPGADDSFINVLHIKVPFLR